tara:strand:- start:397 stop:627 length:231 start_codon:yes stop_codon:yes gene_type:complete
MAYKQKNHPFPVTSCGRRRTYMQRKSGPPQATHTMPDGTVMPGATHGEKTSPLGCYENYKRKPGTEEFSKGSCIPK